MSKPYMCGDDVAVYMPEGGCDCNYTLQKVEDANFYGVYKLMLNGEQVGETVEIPYDRYVTRGDFLPVTTPDYPYEGATVGDFYIQLSVTDDSGYVSFVYIPLGSLGTENYYTKTEVDGLLANLNSYVIVDSLPATGDGNKIYLVDDGHGGYDRYVYVDDEWVNIGSTSIDLSNYYTKSEINTNYFTKAQVRDLIYPVGSIYMSMNNVNPSTLFGGTWEAIEDRFLLAASEGGAGLTGGSELHNHGGNTNPTRLTINQLPYIEGLATFRSYMRGDATPYASLTTASGVFSRTSGGTLNTIEGGSNAAGGSTSILKLAFGKDQEHSHGIENAVHMPPYLTVYMWRRTA